MSGLRSVLITICMQLCESRIRMLGGLIDALSATVQAAMLNAHARLRQATI
jgi:hypothetical protein